MACRDRVEILSVTAPTALIIDLPLGLAVIYGIAAILWYELLRAAVLGRVARLRGRHGRERSREGVEKAELEKRQRAAAEQEAAEASEPDVARRLYYLARKAASAERDLAVQTASEAAASAVERIEDRYREIASELDEEEAERLSDGPSGESGL
jgi:hypothetical protein